MTRMPASIISKILTCRNFSLLTRLIGRQKFEKKGANPGGDGGSSLNMRSLFKYVTYWNPSLRADTSGNADIEFTVPDNLTGWHIHSHGRTLPATASVLAKVISRSTGRPKFVPRCRTKSPKADTFAARFSVMNRTKTERTLKVSISAEGDIDTSTTPGHMEKMISLKPYERALVELPVKAGKIDEKRNIETGEVRFSVEAGDAADSDGMKHQLPVRKMRSLDVAANYGTTLSDKIEEPIQFPDNIYPDVGSVSVSVAPTVLGNLEGAFKYMRDYPYPCWEQVLYTGG